MTSLILVAGIIIVISATCSLFESVLYSVPRSHVEILELKKQSAGKILKKLRQEIDRPIAAILSLNTIANTGGGIIAGALAAIVLGPSKTIYFSIIFTLFILLFAEVIPKTIGVVYSRNLAPWIAHPLHWLVSAFRPILALTQLLTRLILSGKHEYRVSDEEVLTLVGAGLRSGDFQPHEVTMITNVLALEKKTAAEILMPQKLVFALEAQTTVKQASENNRLLNHSRIPVFDKELEDIVGLVHRNDILTAMAKDQFEVKVENLMRPIHFVISTTPLDQLLWTFLERREHLVSVIDKSGQFSGIVTLEDVMEELIGLEIIDETDQKINPRIFSHQRRDEIQKKLPEAF